MHSVDLIYPKAVNQHNKTLEFIKQRNRDVAICRISFADCTKKSSSSYNTTIGYVSRKLPVWVYRCISTDIICFRENYILLRRFSASTWRSRVWTTLVPVATTIFVNY